jgi:hypothetical protein
LLDNESFFQQSESFLDHSHLLLFFFGLFFVSFFPLPVLFFAFLYFFTFFVFSFLSRLPFFHKPWILPHLRQKHLRTSFFTTPHVIHLDNHLSSHHHLTLPTLFQDFHPVSLIDFTLIKSDSHPVSRTTPVHHEYFDDDDSLTFLDVTEGQDDAVSYLQYVTESDFFLQYFSFHKVVPFPFSYLRPSFVNPILHHDEYVHFHSVLDALFLHPAFPYASIPLEGEYLFFQDHLSLGDHPAFGDLFPVLFDPLIQRTQPFPIFQPAPLMLFLEFLIPQIFDPLDPDDELTFVDEDGDSSDLDPHDDDENLFQFLDLDFMSVTFNFPDFDHLETVIQEIPPSYQKEPHFFLAFFLHLSFFYRILLSLDIHPFYTFFSSLKKNQRLLHFTK